VRDGKAVLCRHAALDGWCVHIGDGVKCVGWVAGLGEGCGEGVGAIALQCLSQKTCMQIPF
jgi:hypothetical protein